MADLAALLDKEASAEIEAILAEARERASAITSEAERDAAALVATRERSAQSAREAALVRARSAAQLEAASMRLNAQQAAIQSVFDGVNREIDALRSDATRYASVLEALLREAVAGLTGAPDAVIVHPDEEAIARQAMAAVGIEAALKTDASIRAGVQIVTGPMRVENSLPARLDALRDELASDVAAVLRSEEG